MRALVVIDVQAGFDDPRWGRRDNPEAEANVAALLDAWRRHGQPVVVVRHDSVLPDSPLAPGQPGNDLKDLGGGAPDLLVVKSVNSAFYGDPDLHRWLQHRGIEALAVCGITTNHCCETTARMAGNLGYDVQFVLDATAAFDRTDLDGQAIPAELLRRVTAANLQDEFADVVTTTRAIETLRPA
jgi:nicotinamidase-related amidase